MTKTAKTGKSRKQKRIRFSKKSFKKGGFSMPSFSMPSFSGNKVPQETMDFDFEKDFKIYRKTSGQPVYMETARTNAEGNREITIDFSNATNTARCLGLGLAIRKGIIFFISEISNNDPAAIKYANDNIKLNKDNVCLSKNNTIVLTYNNDMLLTFTINGFPLIQGPINFEGFHIILKVYHNSLVGKGKLFDAASNMKLIRKNVAQAVAQAEILEGNNKTVSVTDVGVTDVDVF
jgi:hypothetical protein